MKQVIEFDFDAAWNPANEQSTKTIQLKNIKEDWMKTTTRSNQMLEPKDEGFVAPETQAIGTGDGGPAGSSGGDGDNGDGDEGTKA